MAETLAPYTKPVGRHVHTPAAVHAICGVIYYLLEISHAGYKVADIYTRPCPVKGDT